MKIKAQPLLWLLSGLFLLSLPFLFAFQAREIREELSQTLSYLGNAIIPALFPFLLAGSLVCHPAVFGRLLRRFPDPFLLFLPIALVSGYPIGGILLRQAVEQHILSAKEAKWMLCALSYPSPAFLFTIAGGILQSQALAWLIFAAIVLGYLPFLIPALCRKKSCSSAAVHSCPLSADLIPSSMAHAGETLLQICFATLSVACFLPSLSALFSANQTLVAICGSLLDVGGGLRLLSAARPGRLFHLTFVLAFGGISVFCQMAVILKKSGISLVPYLVSRPIASLSATLWLWLLVRLFPIAETTVTFVDIGFSASPVAAVFLLLMVAFSLQIV